MPNARAEILARLRAAPREPVAARPPRPQLSECALDRAQMIERFTAELTAQTGIVYRLADAGEIPRMLTEIARSENLATVMASADNVMTLLDLQAWGAANGIAVLKPNDFSDREAFREAVFQVDAAITGADFAVAETGSLGLILAREQPRLLTIAPPLHIAIVPVERFVPVYEHVTQSIFTRPDHIPSQVCFITGPSASADIQATAFKGMHGPRKLIVIVVG